MSKIFEMFYSLATGKPLHSRELKYSGRVGGLAVMIDMLAEEIKFSLPDTPLFIVCRLTLDAAYEIVESDHHFFNCPEGSDQRFESFLAAMSLRPWQSLKANNLVDGYCGVLSFVDNFHVIYGVCHFSGGGSFIYATVIMPDGVQMSGQPGRLYSEIITEITGHFPDDAQLLQDVYEYILRYPIKQRLTDKELAAKFFTNKQKLKELFRRVLDTSVYQFYTTTRLNRAMDLIRNTGLPLQEVALLCGFDDYHHFSVMFKKQFGVRPGSVARE